MGNIEGVRLPRDLNSLVATVETPCKGELSCDLSEGLGNQLEISFTAKEMGKHHIHINKRGRPVNGSPFEIDIFGNLDAKIKPIEKTDETLPKPVEKGIEDS